MALQFSLSSTPSFLSTTSSSSPPSSHVPVTCSVGRSAYFGVWRVGRVNLVRRSGLSVVRSSLDTTSAGATVEVGKVTEVNKDSFWPLVNAAGEKVVVLDMYTQWCGPCKVMAPKFQALSEKYLDVVFTKLDCNKENKSLAKELGLRVVPTFKILKDGKVVKEVTGAKFDDLVFAIDTVKSS